ncbi:hypothetical protein IPL85_00370 [Candidatus Saccharibacteria bacterium]|nr:MAG: hypothetical protein IPL85_00370 [Candidatus Saccharibacteria bacterium]
MSSEHSEESKVSHELGEPQRVVKGWTKYLRVISIAIAAWMRPTDEYKLRIEKLAADPASFEPGGPLCLDIGNTDYVSAAQGLDNYEQPS